MEQVEKVRENVVLKLQTDDQKATVAVNLIVNHK